METISIHKAKASLSGLVSSVEKRGQRVVLSRYGKPVAEIVPYRARQRTLPHPELSRIRSSGDLTEPSTADWEDA
jgi:prevent-host-death family protein